MSYDISKVTTYTAANISAVPFTIPSNKIKIIHPLSDVTECSIKVLSATTDGFNAVANLLQLNDHPKLVYCYTAGDGTITVHQFFLLQSVSAVSISGPTNGILMALDTVITVPSNTVQDIKWNKVTVLNGGMINYYGDNGLIIFKRAPTKINALVQYNIDNPSNEVLLQLNSGRSILASETLNIPSTLGQLSSQAAVRGEIHFTLVNNSPHDVMITFYYLYITV